MGDHLVDVYDDRYHHIGVMNKVKAHQEGVWHCIFVCLVINPLKDTLLLQKKYSGRYSSHAFNPPDYADMTVAGHYKAGEPIEDGLRELHEEIGVRHIEYKDLFYLGIRQTSASLSDNYIERAFQHIHLLSLDLDLSKYVLGNTEVSSLIEMKVNDAIELAMGNVQAVPATHLLWSLGAAQGEIVEKPLSRNDLIPNFLRMDQFYLRMFVSARRYLNGERRNLFW